MGNKLTANQVCGILNIGVNRLSAWYSWYMDDKYQKPEGLPELPPYEQSEPHGKRYWNEEDVPKIQEFKQFIGRGRAGVMGEYNARSWQKRGKRALENKGRTDLAQDYFKENN